MIMLHVAHHCSALFRRGLCCVVVVLQLVRVGVVPRPPTVVPRYGVFTLAGVFRPKYVFVVDVELSTKHRTCAGDRR